MTQNVLRLEYRHTPINILIKSEQLILSSKAKYIIATSLKVRPLNRDSAAQWHHDKFLSSIHDVILKDLIVTTYIVRKHTRYYVDGSKIMNYYLIPRNETTPSKSWRPFKQFTKSFQVKGNVMLRKRKDIFFTTSQFLIFEKLE